MKIAIVLSCLAVLAAMTSAAPPRPLAKMAEVGFVLPIMMRDYGSIVEAEAASNPNTVKSAGRGCVWQDMCTDRPCAPVRVCPVSESFTLFY